MAAPCSRIWGLAGPGRGCSTAAHTWAAMPGYHCSRKLKPVNVASAACMLITTAAAGKTGLDLLEHSCDMIDSNSGLEAGKRLVKRLRALPTSEELKLMIAILQQGMTAAQGA